MRRRTDWRSIPVLVVTAKDLTQEDRERLNGRVERILEKRDRDNLLEEVSLALARLVERSGGRRSAGQSA
jgi:CheY-like chemotaxis protein